MEFKYTEDQIALRRAVREWAQSYLAPKAEEIDVNNRFPTETIKALGEQDLMGLAYPEELGGAGYDAISEAIAMEEISAACASTGSIITGHYLGFDALYLAGTPEQKEKWLRPALEGEKYAAFCLTEPAGGSDMTSNKTTAVEDGDYYVINGVKHFITGGAHCDFLCCFAITNKEDPKHGMTCFVVEKDELNGGYRLALDVVDRGRIGIAAMAVGIGQAALDLAIKYAKEREVFKRPISKFQGIQWMLADAATQLEAARMLTYYAADLKEQGVPFTKQAAMAKLFAAEASHKVVDTALQIHGGYGYMKEYAIERIYRDQRITELFEGTSQVQKIVIAGQLLH